MIDGFHREFRLDDWLVQPAQCRLSKDGLARQVRPKVMDLLTYLAAHRGDVEVSETSMSCFDEAGDLLAR